MAEIVTIHICPNGCSKGTFTTSAHVMQDWLVDAEGNYMDCVNDCVQVDAGPDNDNIWTCDECGAEAEAIEVIKLTAGLGGNTLYVERDRSDTKPPRAFFNYPSKEEMQVADVLKDKDGYYVVWGGARIVI